MNILLFFKINNETPVVHTFVLKTIFKSDYIAKIMSCLIK